MAFSETEMAAMHQKIDGIIAAGTLGDRSLNNQEIDRIKTLKHLLDLKKNPFPAEEYKVTKYSKDIIDEFFKELKTTLTLLLKISISRKKKDLIFLLNDVQGLGSVYIKTIKNEINSNKTKVEGLLDSNILFNKLPSFLHKSIQKFTQALLLFIRKEEEGYASDLLNRIDTLSNKELQKIWSADNKLFKSLGYGGNRKRIIKKDHKKGLPVSLAGRIVTMNNKGKTFFVKIQDSKGIIQLFINRNVLCSDDDKSIYDIVVKKVLNLGDYIGVKGSVFGTNTGELSIRVTDLTFLSKSIRPLPIVKKDVDGNVFDGFTNPELRYRQRYVDLTVNPEVKDVFVKRSLLLRTMRNFFDDKGWMEVETPVLQPIHGGAAARPFETHHNTLDMPLYMRIANELYLKRLIVGGFEGVYEIGKMFRNEGMDSTHNPEFTCMEVYVSYKDYIWMMEMVESLLETITMKLHGQTSVPIGEHTVDFKGPYLKLTMFESIEKYTGIDVSKMDEAGLREVCKNLDIKVDPTMGKGKLIDEIFGKKVEANLIQPTYITDYPIEMTPLAKKHRSKEGLVERFELFVNGKEIANAYSELNDPIDQRGRFTDQLALAARGDDEAMVIDEDFLRALEYGMPPTSGLGIGIDRLVMMMTNNSSIQEVLFFPQMKLEVTQANAEVE